MTQSKKIPANELRCAVFSSQTQTADFTQCGLLKSFPWESKTNGHQSDINLALQLIRSEEKYRALVNASADVIIWVDLNGIMLDINRTEGEITKEQVIGSHVASFCSPNYQVPLNQALEAAKRSQIPQLVATEFIHPHNSPNYYETIVSPVVFNNEVTGFLFCTRNVTNLKVAELKALEQNSTTESILENAQAGHWKWNIKDDSAHFSQTFRKMLGYADEEPIPDFS